MHKVLLNVNETVAATGLSRSTVYDLMRTGALGSVKVGARRLVPVAELEAFVARLQETAA